MLRVHILPFCDYSYIHNWNDVILSEVIIRHLIGKKLLDIRKHLDKQIALLLSKQIAEFNNAQPLNRRHTSQVTLPMSMTLINLFLYLFIN